MIVRDDAVGNYRPDIFQPASKQASVFNTMRLAFDAEQCARIVDRFYWLLLSIRDTVGTVPFTAIFRRAP